MATLLTPRLTAVSGITRAAGTFGGVNLDLGISGELAAAIASLQVNTMIIDGTLGGDIQGVWEVHKQPGVVDVVGGIVRLVVPQINTNLLFRGIEWFDSHATAGFAVQGVSQWQQDYTAAPILERPLTTQNLSFAQHNFGAGGDPDIYFELLITYHILKLDTSELVRVVAGRAA